MKTTEQVIRHYTLKEGDYSISMTTADNDHLRIETHKGKKEFVFENLYCEDNLDKWEKVLKLMSKAVKLARLMLDVEVK